MDVRPVSSGKTVFTQAAERGEIADGDSLGRRRVTQFTLRWATTMIPIVIALVIVIGCVVVLLVLRRGVTPSVAMFAEIRTAILDLQRVASHNIFPAEQCQKLTGFDQEEMLQQSCHVRDAIRYVYTVGECETGLVHVVSSQLLKPKPEKYQIQCMLVAMLTLNQCLADAGIDPKSVEFGIDRSPTGTHYVSMSLTRDQHDRMMAKRNAA